MEPGTRSKAAKGTLRVRVRLHGGAFGSADEQRRLVDAEEAIEAILERETRARLDGNEVGGGIWTLVIVGPDLDRAQKVAASRLVDAGVPETDTEFVAPFRPTRVLVGSIVAVPVDGSFAYFQYVGKDPHQEMGDMVIVFAETTSRPVRAGELRLDRRLFGPVFAAIRWPIGQREWTVVGRRTIEKEPFPGFRYLAPLRPGRGDEWVVWDGTTHARVGILSEDEARLEERTTYLPAGLVRRISDELARGRGARDLL